MKIFISLFCFLLFSASGLKSQGLDVGIGVGASGYLGDLDHDKLSKDMFNVKIAFELEGTYIFNRWFATTASFLYGGMKGDDEGRSNPVDNRNLHFKSSLFELGLLGEFHFLGNSDLQDPLFVSPYLTLGVAGFYYNPKALYNGDYYELRDLKTEGQGIEGYNDQYSLYNVSIPFGIGAKFRLKGPYAIKFDILGRYTFTDYLDDVSGDYVSYNQLVENGGELSPVFSDRRLNPTYVGERGNSSKKDLYFTYMVTFVYNIISTNRNGVFCPTVEKPEF